MERTSFNLDSAQRIANVVRAVENARAPGQALEARRPFIASKPKLFVLAKFTGSSAWLRMTTRQCLLFPTSTDTVSATPLYLGKFVGDTVTAVSLMFSMPGFTGATTLPNYTTLGRYVMLSKVNGVYQVIAGEGN